MAITIRDLKNKEYQNTELISFEYFLDLPVELEMLRNRLVIKFTKCLPQSDVENNKDIWNVVVNIENQVLNITHTYSTFVSPPSRNLPIEKLVSMAIYNLKNILSNEVQIKSLIEFELGNKIADML